MDENFVGPLPNFETGKTRKQIEDEMYGKPGVNSVPKSEPLPWHHLEQKWFGVDAGAKKPAVTVAVTKGDGTIEHVAEDDFKLE